jgi:hypothetical protein
MVIKKVLSTLLVIVFILIASLPAILSTTFINKHLIAHINKEIPGKISASRLTFSWISGITIHDLALYDPEDREVAKALKIASPKFLLSWLYSPSSLEKITLIKPAITLIDDKERSGYSIQHVFSTPSQSDSSSNIPNGLTLDIQEASIAFSNHTSLVDVVATISIQDDKLTLNNPLTAKLALPENADTRAHGTIKFDIDNKGLCIHLKPFSLDSMQIQSATIDPGIITLQNGGLLGSLLSFLRLNLRSNSQVPMWFTPLYMQLKDSIITCQRTDILVSNAFPIALWGNIDLIKDRVDMRLGLSAQTLRRAFALVIINSDFLLQIPILGPVSAPRIDTAGATTRIAGLRLQQTPFPPTILFGSLLRATTSISDRNEPDPPPPTTTPFPWQ